MRTARALLLVCAVAYPTVFLVFGHLAAGKSDLPGSIVILPALGGPIIILTAAVLGASYAEKKLGRSGWWGLACFLLPPVFCPLLAVLPPVNSRRMRSYRSQKWGLSLDYPQTWEVVWQHEPDGPWEIVVGVAGKPTPAGRACVTIRAMRDELLAPDVAHITVFAAGGPGKPQELPRTPAEYVEGSKDQLAKTLPGFSFISSEVGSIAGMRAATLIYAWLGEAGRIRERQVNLFGAGVSFRLLCEAPASDAAEAESYFQGVVSAFKPRA
jgi:hypothetical protein